MAYIGLDYGHGNNTFPPDKGVYVDGKGYAEHDFNAKLGLKLKKKLIDAGHKIYEAQPANAPDVNLNQRIRQYNNHGVDLVWSVHANANSNEDAQGRCAFYWHTSSQSKKAADLLVDEIKKAGYSTHGHGLHASQRGSWTNLAICRDTAMPAVLSENGFMTNDEPGINDDFELIFGSKQEEYTDELAKAHFNAIQRYFDLEPGKKAKKVSKPSKPKPSKSKTSNKANLIVDGKWGSATTKALQKALGTGYSDGILSSQSRNSVTKALYGGITWGSGGSPTVEVLQRKVGSKVDGLLGPDTVRKLQSYLGTPVDGVISRPSSMVVEELQKRLNAGTF